MGPHGQRAHGWCPMGDGICGGTATHGDGERAESKGEHRRGEIFIPLWADVRCETCGRGDDANHYTRLF